jgi:hypothetical protein
MRFRSILAGLAMCVAAVLPAAAQRGPAPGTWELLGEERVGLGKDRDRLEIRQPEAWWREKAFRALRFVVQGGEVKVRQITLTYINGHTEQVSFSGTLRPGQQVDVPLRGERSYLAAIDFDYSSKFSISIGPGGLSLGQATMRVYGENVRGGPPPVRPVPPPSAGGRGWDTLASVRFNRTDARVEIPVSRREGRVGQIRLIYNGDRGVIVKEMRIRFGNGETQNVLLEERLDDGYSTRGIDLKGDQRFIERIVVILDPRREGGRANFTVEGNERPGSEAPRRGEGRLAREGWELLGRQTVGFNVDRDVIRINQNESWWGGNRGYDKLHFTAENSEIHMMGIRVVYINGYAESYKVDRLIPAGGDLAVDLPGSRSYIREIEMTYRARQNYSGQAVMSVFGERGRR